MFHFFIIFHVWYEVACVCFTAYSLVSVSLDVFQKKKKLCRKLYNYFFLLCLFNIQLHNHKQFHCQLIFYCVLKLLRCCQLISALVYSDGPPSSFEEKTFDDLVCKCNVALLRLSKQEKMYRTIYVQYNWKMNIQLACKINAGSNQC